MLPQKRRIKPKIIWQMQRRRGLLGDKNPVKMRAGVVCLIQETETGMVTYQKAPARSHVLRVHDVASQRPYFQEASPHYELQGRKPSVIQFGGLLEVPYTLIRPRL